MATDKIEHESNPAVFTFVEHPPGASRNELVRHLREAHGLQAAGETEISQEVHEALHRAGYVAVPTVRVHDAAGNPEDRVLRTKSGRILTEADLEHWADEAEGLENLGPLFTYADLSTAHLPEREMTEITAAPPRVIEHEYGAWVNTMHGSTEQEIAEKFDEEEAFPSLRRVLSWARARGANWVNFDRDADTIADLPTWEW